MAVMSGLIGLGSTSGASGETVLFVLVLFFGGAFLMYHGGKLKAVSAEEVLDHDPRSPILYLRSFGDEVLDQSFWAILKGAFGRRVAMETGGWGPTEQYMFAKELKKVGPYIAVGRPGEKLPEIGAARLYISDSEWHEKVLALIKRARLVVVRAGRSSGLVWEIEQLVTHLNPQQILVILPVAKKDYEPFRNWAVAVLPGGLPEKAPAERLLTFGNNWKPILLNDIGTIARTLLPFFKANNINLPE